MKAAEKITQADEDLPTDNGPKKKKMSAAFQLSSKVIPDDAGNIKVCSPDSNWSMSQQCYTSRKHCGFTFNCLGGYCIKVQ
jgi:hypothetical protein